MAPTRYIDSAALLGDAEGASAAKLQARLKQEACNVPIIFIFITAFDDAGTRAQAIKEGAVEFLAKTIRSPDVAQIAARHPR